MAEERAAHASAGRLADLVLRTLIAAGPRAVILHGSLASGDFIPGTSDIDLLVVVERSLADPDAERLVRRMRQACAETGCPIDLRVVTAAAAAGRSSGPALELYVGCHGGTIEVERSIPEPDLVVEFRVARAHGQTLRGALPKEIIAPVEDAPVTRYGLGIIERWLTLTDDDRHAELMVLTACRIWRLAVEGVISSKAGAGQWALRREPSLVAIDGAIRRRKGEPGVPIRADDIRAVLEAAERAARMALQR